MNDFETHPPGTADRIAELEDENARLREERLAFAIEMAVVILSEIRNSENARLREAWTLGRELESGPNGLDFKYASVDEALAAVQEDSDE